MGSITYILILAVLGRICGAQLVTVEVTSTYTAFETVANGQVMTVEGCSPLQLCDQVIMGTNATLETGSPITNPPTIFPESVSTGTIDILSSSSSIQPPAARAFTLQGSGVFADFNIIWAVDGSVLLVRAGTSMDGQTFMILTDDGQLQDATNRQEIAFLRLNQTLSQAGSRKVRDTFNFRRQGSNAFRQDICDMLHNENSNLQPTDQIEIFFLDQDLTIPGGPIDSKLARQAPGAGTRGQLRFRSQDCIYDLYAGPRNEESRYVYMGCLGASAQLPPQLQPLTVLASPVTAIPTQATALTSARTPGTVSTLGQSTTTTSLVSSDNIHQTLSETFSRTFRPLPPSPTGPQPQTNNPLPPSTPTPGSELPPTPISSTTSATLQGVIALETPLFSDTTRDYINAFGNLSVPFPLYFWNNYSTVEYASTNAIFSTQMGNGNRSQTTIPNGDIPGVSIVLLGVPDSRFSIKGNTAQGIFYQICGNKPQRQLFVYYRLGESLSTDIQYDMTLMYRETVPGTITISFNKLMRYSLAGEATIGAQGINDQVYPGAISYPTRPIRDGTVVEFVALGDFARYNDITASTGGILIPDQRQCYMDSTPPDPCPQGLSYPFSRDRPISFWADRSQSWTNAVQSASIGYDLYLYRVRGGMYFSTDGMMGLGSPDTSPNFGGPFPTNRGPSLNIAFFWQAGSANGFRASADTDQGIFWRSPGAPGSRFVIVDWILARGVGGPVYNISLLYEESTPKILTVFYHELNGDTGSGSTIGMASRDEGLYTMWTSPLFNGQVLKFDTSLNIITDITAQYNGSLCSESSSSTTVTATTSSTDLGAIND